jgi:hypothetical protein
MVPEIPTVLAIFYATVITGDMVYSVYKKEKASSQYTGGGNRISMIVFKQATWFIGAFYFTWVPYLVLQVRRATMHTINDGNKTLFPVLFL